MKTIEDIIIGLAGVSDGWETTFTHDEVRTALAEFAKQQSIAFAKYMNVIAVRNGLDHWIVGSGRDTKRYTTSELYERFLNSQQ